MARQIKQQTRTNEHRLFMVAAVTMLIVALFAVAVVLRQHAISMGEEMLYAMNPSAERAFAYGERHFDARHNASYYDIARAERWFRIAAQKDPQLPYVYHELARIAFLRSDFNRALMLINVQINMHGDAAPNSYYVRALIEGYMGAYEQSASDYAYFLRFDRDNWAANNDYAWVLLKAGKPRDAAVAVAQGLQANPENPWLLNTSAVALAEIGLPEAAREEQRRAVRAVMSVEEQDWLRAYPGNDPAIAPMGIMTFQDANIRNMHRLIIGSSSSTLQ